MILDQIAAHQQDEKQQAIQASKRREMEEWLDQQPLCFTEYDDTLTRRFVERITVVDAETIQVKIKDCCLCFMCSPFFVGVGNSFLLIFRAYLGYKNGEVDFKSFGQAVSHITISDGTITVHPALKLRKICR